MSLAMTEIELSHLVIVLGVPKILCAQYSHNLCQIGSRPQPPLPRHRAGLQADLDALCSLLLGHHCGLSAAWGREGVPARWARLIAINSGRVEKYDCIWAGLGENPAPRHLWVAMV